MLREQDWGRVMEEGGGLCSSAPVSCRCDLTVDTLQLCQYKFRKLFKRAWRVSRHVNVPRCTVNQTTRAGGRAGGRAAVCVFVCGRVLCLLRSLWTSPPCPDWGLLTFGLWPAKELPTKHPASSSSAANYRSTNTPLRVWNNYKTWTPINPLNPLGLNLPSDSDCCHAGRKVAFKSYLMHLQVYA